ncbi:hypothetical protein RJT34_12819 [Clitoria ternatea]|uniref:Transmembrane protein n=1 Tax=Clitoria ternatea TaxID=43366 RepID=A0AAN9JQK1_CLITE
MVGGSVLTGLGGELDYVRALKVQRRMEKRQVVFSLRHMLVMLLALNMCLILRMFLDSDETLANNTVEVGVNSKRERHVI